MTRDSKPVEGLHEHPRSRHVVHGMISRIPRLPADPHVADPAVATTALDALVAVFVDIGKVPEKVPFLGRQAIHVCDGDDPVHELDNGLFVVLVLVVLAVRVSLSVWRARRQQKAAYLEIAPCGEALATSVKLAFERLRVAVRLHVRLKVAALGEPRIALVALERTFPGVKAIMRFEVARLGEEPAAAIPRTGLLLVSLCAGTNSG